MKKEELKTATNDELIYELDYCGYDSYYGDYRDDIVSEIKKRIQEPVLDKIRAEVDNMPNLFPFTDHIDAYVKAKEVLQIIDKYRDRAESEGEE